MLVIVVDFAFVEAVVAAGDDVEPEREQVFRNGWCNPKTTGTVFTVGNGQINLPFGNDPAQVVNHHSPTGGSENVADKEDIHSEIRIKKANPKITLAPQALSLTFERARGDRRSL